MRKRILISTLLGVALIAGFALAAPPCTSTDLNGDGVKNLSDVVILAQLYLSGVYAASIDFNCDGVNNIADVALFAL